VVFCGKGKKKRIRAYLFRGDQKKKKRGENLVWPGHRAGQQTLTSGGKKRGEAVLGGGKKKNRLAAGPTERGEKKKKGRGDEGEQRIPQASAADQLPHRGSGRLT